MARRRISPVPRCWVPAGIGGAAGGRRCGQAVLPAGGGLGSIGLITPVSTHFCAQCNRIRLTADGYVKPCLHAAAEFPIKGLSQEEMAQQMERAILAKSPCHAPLTYGHQSHAERNMNQIGG